MTPSDGNGFLVVQGMSWPALRCVSGALRKLGHDLNNAMVPAFGSADILRLRHANTTVAADLDKLAARLVGVRDTVGRATAHSLRHRHARPPTLRSIHGDMANQALAARVGLRWQNDLPPDNALPGLDGHEAHLLVAALVSNALEAHGDDSQAAEEDGRRPQVWVHLCPGEGQEVIIEVRDNGPGCRQLTEAAAGLATRRTWGHIGLGLQVVATLAQRGGGHLRIRNLQPGGFEARVTLGTPTGLSGDFRPPEA